MDIWITGTESIINGSKIIGPRENFLHALTMYRNGFWYGGITTLIHDFCIPLDFLGIKGLEKDRKRAIFFSKATDKAKATLIEILYFCCLMWTVLT